MRNYTTLLLTLLALSACKKEKQADMPPATGPGAAAMPELPVVEPGDEKTDPVAPSEGRTTGTTVAHAEAHIAANASGVIISIPVKEDDKVKKGDLLFKQDARDAQLRARQAKTALDGAQVALRAAEADYNRTKAMVEQGAMNRAALDAIQARYDGARVGVEQARVVLQMAQKGVADTVVKSPMDGVVVTKFRSEGDMATMMPPTVVLLIQDLSVLDLHVRLPESALKQIKVGDTLTVDFEAVGVGLEAKIVRILPTVDPRTRMIEVIAEIPNPDMRLRPGLLANVQLGAAPSGSGSKP